MMAKVIYRLWKDENKDFARDASSRVNSRNSSRFRRAVVPRLHMRFVAKELRALDHMRR